mgnify:CR=1 FL=1
MEQQERVTFPNLADYDIPEPIDHFTEASAEVKFSQRGGIYLCRWVSRNIDIRFERLKEDSRFNVYAEATINIRAPLSFSFRDRVNLVSVTAQQKLAKLVAAKYDLEDGAWGELLQVACENTLANYRAGEPAQRVADIGVRESLRYLVNPLLVSNQPNLFFGKGGSTKSLLATYLVALVESGEYSHGFVAERGRGLYLDYESDASEFAERMKALSRGMGLEDVPNPLYRRCHQPLAADIEAIHRIVIENEITFVVVDSAGLAVNGDPNEIKPTTEFFSALRSLNVTSLTIAHQPKDKERSSQPMGSSYWENAPRSVFRIKGVEGLDGVETGVFHTKANGVRFREPLGFRWTFHERREVVERIEVERIRPSTVPDLAKEVSLRIRIFDALQHGEMEEGALIEELETNSNALRMVLARDKGKTFQRIGESWSLISSREQY